jgi:heme A synthase
MKTAVLLTAAVLIVLGVLFTLQGIGLVGGSVMTGDRTWAVIGPVLAVIGVVLGGWALRRRAGQS